MFIKIIQEMNNIKDKFNCHFKIIKYEDIVDSRDVLEPILDFCNINLDSIDDNYLHQKSLNKWKKDSSNKELRLFIKSFLETIFYTNTLQRDRFIHNKIVEEYRSDKIRAVERARKADLKVEKLQKEIINLKKLTNL